MNTAVFGVLMLCAPPTPYGGELTVVHRGPLRLGTGTEALSHASQTLRAAAYERLYVSRNGSLVPELASGPPVNIEGGFRIPLRPRAQLHDGSTLTAQDVARSLMALQTTRHAHITAGFDAIRGAEGPAIEVLGKGLERTTLRSLAAPEAAIIVPRGDTFVGTGPFDWTTDAGEQVLLPHRGHRQGRPFLDRVIFKQVSSSAEARQVLARAHHGLLLDYPAMPAAGLQAFEGARQGVIVALAIGRKNVLLRNAAVAATIDATVDRGRLARRYLRRGAHATADLFGSPYQTPRAVPQRGEMLEATLLIPRGSRFSGRFIERLQLELHRAGVSAQVRREEMATVTRRGRTGRFELMLVVLPWRANEKRRLLSLLATQFDDNVLLEAASTSKEEQLEVLERQARQRHGLLPLAAVESAAFYTRSLSGVRVRGDTIDLSDVHLRGRPR